MPASAPFDLHLIVNTHWDREWRWSFRETQTRLLQALDLLLDTMERDPRFHAFHTDAQVSPIDDYLELRPENRSRVEALVRAGRLQIGPWYTLPAEFLVSGEALVRNLLLGHRLSRRYGGVMKVAYNIFSWGQVSQLPQIYRQFGMDTVIFYRGVDQSVLPSLEFWWEAPDGHRSLGLTFGSQHRLNFWAFVYRPYIIGQSKLGMDRAGGHGYLVNLSDSYSRDVNHWLVDQICAQEPSALTKGMQKLIDTLRSKASTSHLLCFQGFDLENPDPMVTDIVDKINTTLPNGRLRISTLPDYLSTLRAVLARDGLLERLPILRGEMLEPERVDASYGDLFSQVFSARMPIKLANAAAEVRLERWAEPACAWASTAGFSYPERQLEVAWKELLKNQQHDGIGGAHNDRVSETMGERYRDVQDLAEVTCRQALQHLVGQIDCSSLNERETGLVVFHAGSRAASPVVEAVVDIPAEYFGGDAIFARVGGFVSQKQLLLRGADGGRWPAQVLDQWEELVYAYRKFGAHVGQTMRRFRVAFAPGELPAQGYACGIASFQDRMERPAATLNPAPHVLANEHLRVVLHGDGTFDLTHLASGHTYERQHYFLDEAETGNPLVHRETPDNGARTTLGQPADIALVNAGPLVATYRITRTWALPVGFDAPLKPWPPQVGDWIEPGRPHRAEERRPVTITTEITLRHGSRVLECRTTIDNTVRDHRLRLVLPTGLDPERHVADAPFDVVARKVQRPDASGWREAALAQWPMSSWVDVADTQRGLAFLHRWVGEYEVFDRHRGELAVTLLRCFSCPGGLGETYQAQELAQCLSRHTFEYALYPHDGDWRAANVPALAEAFRIPVRVAQTSRHPGSRPFRSHSFVTIEEAPDFVLTCCKREERGDRLILRGFNPTGQEIRPRFRFGFPVRRASQLTLEETEIAPAPLDGDGTCALSVPRGAIVTLALEIASSP